MATLLLVFAHPDDEGMSSGAVMKARAEGHRVVLVTATRGEVGEIYNMDEASSRPRLGEIRTQELEAAARVIGINRGEFLDYRDSGMVGTADNEDPRSFNKAPIDEAAGKLIAILREERPEVVVTFGEDGMYGHPDHVKIHHVTNAALDQMLRTSERWTPRKLYYTAIPRSLMQAFMQQMQEDMRMDQNPDMRVEGTPDELVTTRLDVSAFIDRKRQAFAAHVSQNDPNSWFAKIPDEVYEVAFGTEYYALARGKPGSPLPESDLFAGIA
jgi:LmbE family N-acetylglucosaminyl deacetylase